MYFIFLSLFSYPLPPLYSICWSLQLSGAAAAEDDQPAPAFCAGVLTDVSIILIFLAKEMWPYKN